MKAMDWINSIISVVAFIGTIYAYIRRGKEIKDQEKQLNAIVIQKHEEDERLKRSADVKGNIIQTGTGKRILRIYNKGQANARNIRLDILGDTEGLIILPNQIFPYELLTPYDHCDIIFFCRANSVSTLKICLTWDDDCKGRFSEQVLFI